MSNSNNIPIYTITHISSYVNGTMKREDMYVFEKAMLDDPFLEDAVEGFREANINKAETDVAAIKAALLPEKEKATIVPFYTTYKTWFSAAAAIIVIGTIGAVTFAILKPSNSNQQVAIVTPTTDKPKAFTDSTETINNSLTIATNKPNTTIAASKKQPIIVADKEVVLSIAKQASVSSLQDDDVKIVDSISFYTNTYVAKLSEKEMKSTQPISIDQALQGRLSGVAVTQKDNRNNQAITTRGANSFNSNQQPLYIVDGKPYDSLPSFASVNNIKNIEILKDSATKVYGSRAKNGVVLVTTNEYVTDQEAKKNYLKESITKNEAAKSLQKSTLLSAKDAARTDKNTLDEVEVIGYGTAKKRAVTGNVAKVAIDPLDSLMPVGGWQYYSKYMTRKIGFIGDTTSNNHFVVNDRTGNRLDDIDIEFSVDKEGTAYNVKVITDVDTTQVKAITNAVVEGPKWISRKKKNKVKIPLKTP